MKPTRSIVPRSAALAALAICIGIGAVATSALQSSKDQSSAKETQPGPAEFGAQLQQPGYRKVLTIRGAQALLSHVQPGDASVEIVDVSLAPAMSAVPEAQSLVESMTRRASAVAVVSIQRVASRPTEDANWIESDVIATVEDIRKNDMARPLSNSDNIGFTTPGGTVVVGKTKITAYKHQERPFESGHSYLVFFDRDERGALAANAGNALEIRGKQLKAMAIDGPLAWIPEIDDKDKVLQEIAVFSAVKRD